MRAGAGCARRWAPRAPQERVCSVRESLPAWSAAPFVHKCTCVARLPRAPRCARPRPALQALHTRAAERTLVLEARRSAEAAEIKRLEGKAAMELHTLSAAEQQRLQDQLGDARFRWERVQGDCGTACRLNFGGVDAGAAPP